GRTRAISHRSQSQAGRDRALREPSRRPLDRPRHQPDREALRHLPGRRLLSASAQLPPRLRHAPAGRWRRPSRYSGAARPRAPFDHAEVYAGFARRPDRRLRPRAPQGLKHNRGHMSSNMSRALMLTGVGLALFGITTVVLMNALPGPHTERDYFIIGCLAT